MVCGIWRSTVQRRQKCIDSAPNRVFHNPRWIWSPTRRSSGCELLSHSSRWNVCMKRSPVVRRKQEFRPGVAQILCNSKVECAQSIRSDVEFNRRSRFHSQGSRQRCPRTPGFYGVTRSRVNGEWFREEGARYGLRGVRVGEASHPGPPDEEWTVPDSVIDALEADLTPPVPSTIPASA